MLVRAQQGNKVETTAEGRGEKSLESSEFSLLN